VSREALVAQALAEALGRDPGPLRFDGAGGGCINSAATVDALGERYFVKWNDRPLQGQFAAEAAGLEALRASGSGLVVPRPIAWGDEGPGRSFLVLEHLPPGRRGPGFEEALGRGLAALHQASSEQGFGFGVDGYCGATPQPNGWLDDWPTFYCERRIGHQLELAGRAGLGREGVQAGERLLGRLGGLLADPEPPALIHGDLWSGNLHVTEDGRPGLIDPAAYYGHREAELGMMVLFGGFGRRVFDAYEEARPLQPGWRERLDLYTLYHVLNHFNLFGGGYGSQATGIMRRYL
jgi:fructosamine-3-kinase